MYIVLDTTYDDEPKMLAACSTELEAEQFIVELDKNEYSNSSYTYEYVGTVQNPTNLTWTNLYNFESRRTYIFNSLIKSNDFGFKIFIENIKNKDFSIMSPELKTIEFIKFAFRKTSLRDIILKDIHLYVEILSKRFKD